jgi:hypothetical protein
MDFKLRSEEALEYAILKGKNIKALKKRLSKKYWPNTKQKSQEVNISNFFRGETKRFTFEMIKDLCDETGVDANFLFNVKPMKNINENL